MYTGRSGALEIDSAVYIASFDLYNTHPIPRYKSWMVYVQSLDPSLV